MPAGIAVEATYGSLNLIEVRSWEMERNEIRSFDEKQILEYEVVLTFLAQFDGNTSAANRATDLAALIADLEAQNAAFVLEQDATPIVTLDPAVNTNQGPHVRYHIPDQSDPYKFGYNVPVQVTVTARVDPQGAGPILARSEEIDKAVDDKGFLTVVTRGELKVARGSSAEGQLATVRPATPVGFDQRESYSLDANDLIMRYTFTQTEREEDPPGNAGAGSTWNLAATADSMGREMWVLSGRLVYVGRNKPSEGDVDTLVAKHFPAGVQVQNRSVTNGLHDNSLSFQITGTRAWGKNKFFMFQQTIRVRIARSRRYFLSVDASGEDERQDFARPAVEVTQSGRAIGQGGYPAFPAFLLPEADVDEPVTDIGDLEVDPTTGTVLSGAITWSYRGRILNKVDAGTIADFAAVLKDPKEIIGQYPHVGAKAKANVA
jgi:hypothetical protein